MTKAELAEAEADIEALLPKIEQLKASIEEKSNQIMEAGGPQYKKIKTEYDQVCKDVSESERMLARHKSTIEVNIEKLNNLEEEIGATRDELGNTKQSFEELNRVQAVWANAGDLP